MRTREAGFSLIELMVAMVVTLVVSGAVFALMTAGQGAFRREPAITDRQQNIRVAMDIIQRDLANGGAGMEDWEQVFSRGDGLNEANPLLNGRGPTQGSALGPTPTNQDRDHLQVIGSIDCPSVPLDPDPPGNHAEALVAFPDCYEVPMMLAITMLGPGGVPTTVWGYAWNTQAGQAMINFPFGQQPDRSEVQQIADLRVGPHITVHPVQLIRYEIAAEADGVPGLWRSRLGGVSDDGNYYPAGPAAPAGALWQLIARGIEDMQVRYRPVGGAFQDSPPRVVAGTFPTLTQEVEVTLWARAIAPNLQGESRPAGAQAGLVAAVRGNLVSLTTPRRVLLTLRNPAAGADQWR